MKKLISPAFREKTNIWIISSKEVIGYVVTAAWNIVSLVSDTSNSFSIISVFFFHMFLELLVERFYEDNSFWTE